MSGRTDQATGVGLVLGYALMIFAVVGLLRAISFRSATDVAAWVIGGDLLHDLVVAPAVCLTGFGLARLAPFPWRWPVRAGAIGTAVVLLVAYPALRGFGRRTAPGNGSVLPLDYATATVTVLAIVWGLAAVWGLANLVARRRGRPRSSQRRPLPRIVTQLQRQRRTIAIVPGNGGRWRFANRVRRDRRNVNKLGVRVWVRARRSG